MTSSLPTELQNLVVIRDNQRYATYRALYKGKQVFVKQRKPLGNPENIRREMWGLQTFATLRLVKNLEFEVPKILASGTDYVVTEWAMGQPLAFDPTAQTFNNDVEFFAASFATLDKLTRLAHKLPARFDMKSRDRSGMSRLRERLQAVPYQEFFDSKLIDAGFSYINDNFDYLEARLAHPDFTPANVLEYEGVKTLVDYESTNLLWPRFYDVVNMTYNRMITEPLLTAGCQHIIERYFELDDDIDIKTSAIPFNVIAMARSLSLIWELLTEPNMQHNTSLRLTKETAQRLHISMETILKGTIFFKASL